MQIKLFTVPILGAESAAEALNRFLRSHKVLDIKQELVSGQEGAYWCFCVRYLEGGGSTLLAKSNRNRTKVDYKEVLDTATFERIIHSYETSPGRGVPIGNLTSQYFANYYLAFVDHHIKEDRRERAYVRYLDDLVCWHADKGHLLELSDRLEAYLQEKLHLQLKIRRINRTAAGLTFLGYRLRKHQLLLAPRSKRRFRRKLEAYTAHLANGTWNEVEYQAHALPLLAFAKKANTHGYRRRVLAGIADRYPGL